MFSLAELLKEKLREKYTKHEVKRKAEEVCLFECFFTLNMLNWYHIMSKVNLPLWM